jgi:hypothetical protein
MEVSGAAWALVLGIMSISYGAFWAKQSKYPMAYVESTVDKERYLVRNLPDKQQAADRLARVRERLLSLRKHLEASHKNVKFVDQILNNFDCSPEQFTESTPDAVHTSYTVDKQKVFMCLRQRNEKEELVRENVLVFVALHEMAHVGTESIGHTPEFWNNFAWLLKQAESINVYQYTDFAAHPVEYCGVHITDSPTYKAGVEDGVKPK